MRTSGQKFAIVVASCVKFLAIPGDEQVKRRHKVFRGKTDNSTRYLYPKLKLAPHCSICMNCTSHSKEFYNFYRAISDHPNNLSFINTQKPFSMSAMAPRSMLNAVLMATRFQFRTSLSIPCLYPRVPLNRFSIASKNSFSLDIWKSSEQANLKRTLFL